MVFEAETCPSGSLRVEAIDLESAGFLSKQMSQKFLRPDKHLIVNYVTAREAECALGVSIRSLQRLRRQGVLRIGECWIQIGRAHV